MKDDAPARTIGVQVERALQRLRLVFLQVPGVRLSLAEASRVTELETHLCQVLLSALEDIGFVRRQADGLYNRQSSE